CECPVTKMAQISDLQRLSRPRLHDLHGMGAIEVIACPQRFMSLEQGVDGLLHRSDVELAAQLQGNRNVVGPVVWCELMNEPHALLRYRKPLGSIRGPRLDRRHRFGTILVSQLIVDVMSKRLHSAMLEQQGNGQLDLERVADARCDLRREQRVAADPEEVF